ncbi:MAG: hypothetical protein Q9220_006030 [cf. Caloplaca sp. 1 TL-2023]
MATPVAAKPNDGIQDEESFDEGSYTTSIASSITDYKYEHGRRYHAYKEGRYVLPNDEEEQNRMDLQYHAMRLAFGDKPFFAPLGDKVQRILDAGTGTAPNVKYQVDDLEQPWTFPSSHFDLVHTRIMLGSLRNWPSFFAQSFKHLRPGGYVECHELSVDARADDDTLTKNSAITAWCRNQEEAMQKIGMTLVVTGDVIKGQMQGAGFVDVEVKEFKIPIGQWPEEKHMRETGAFQLVAMLEGISGLTMALWTRFLGWKKEDVEDELVKVKREFRSKSVHSYWPLYVSLIPWSLIRAKG